MASTLLKRTEVEGTTGPNMTQERDQGKEQRVTERVRGQERRCYVARRRVKKKDILKTLKTLKMQMTVPGRRAKSLTSRPRAARITHMATHGPERQAERQAEACVAYGWTPHRRIRKESVTSKLQHLKEGTANTGIQTTNYS